MGSKRKANQISELLLRLKRIVPMIGGLCLIGMSSELSAQYNSLGNVQLTSYGTERLRITTPGWVGIGTTTPRSALDISITGTASALIVPRDTTGNRPQAGFQVNGMIRYNTTNNKFEAYENGAWENMIATASQWTTASSDIYYSSGNVGIGTSSPQNQLTIANGSPVVNIASAGTAGTNQAVLALTTLNDGSSMGTATNLGWQVAARGNAFTTAAQQNDFQLNYWNGTSWVSYFIVDSLTGNVGIGTTGPNSKLQVDGTVSNTVSTYSGAFTCGTSSINFSTSNFQRLSPSNTIAAGTCNVALSNLVAGANYTLVVTGNAAINAVTYTFTGYTYEYLPANAATTAAKDTIYTFLYDGSTVYVTWGGGYQ